MKKNQSKKMFLIITIALMVFMLSAFVFAADAIQEDFEAGIQTDMIIATNADNFMIEDDAGNKTYKIDGIGGWEEVSFGENEWNDYTLNLDIKFLEWKSDWSSIDILFGYQDSTNNSYRLTFNPNALTVNKYVDGIAQKLVTQSYDFSGEDWYAIELTSMDGVYVAKVNGEEVLSVEDAEFENGKFGFGLWESTVAIDNMNIVSEGSETAQETNPETLDQSIVVYILAALIALAGVVTVKKHQANKA